MLGYGRMRSSLPSRAATVFVILAMVLAMVQVPIYASAGTPVVSTDKAEYATGETVTVTVTGLVAGQSYDVAIRLPDGTYASRAATTREGKYSAWATTAAGSSGKLSCTYVLGNTTGKYEARLYEAPWSGEGGAPSLAKTTFNVIRRVIEPEDTSGDESAGTDEGASSNGSDTKRNSSKNSASGEMSKIAEGYASLTTTDGGSTRLYGASTEPAYILRQYANDNGTWTGGNLGASKAHYVEHYSVPYRIEIDNLVAGQSVTVEFKYDTYSGGLHALDFLTGFNHNDYPSHMEYFGHPPEVLGQSDYLSGLADSDYVDLGLTTTWGIPKPANVPAEYFHAGEVMTMYGGTITGMAYTVEDVAEGGGNATYVSVTFTASPNIPSSGGTAVLGWGGHIASMEDYGPGMSAASISGSPYHTSMVTGGSGDCSLSTEAVLTPKPQITLTKTPDPTSVSEPGGNVTYTFVVENTGYTVVTLDSLDDYYDGVHHDITGLVSPTLEGTVLYPPGYSGTEGPYPTSQTFTYTRYVSGTVATSPHINTATIYGTDEYDKPASAEATAQVIIQAISIKLEKEVDTDLLTPGYQTTMPEPGGPVVYTFKVTNTSSRYLVLDSLTDAINYNLPVDITGKVTPNLSGVTLYPYGNPFDHITFTLTENPAYCNVYGNAGYQRYNVATIYAHDLANPSNTTSDDDDALVTIYGTDPAITVEKTAVVGSFDELGGTAVFQVDITNSSDSADDPIDVLSLMDSIEGATGYAPTLYADAGLTTLADPILGLAKGDTATVYFAAPVPAGDPRVINDVVTVTAEDDEGAGCSDDDDADVTVTDVKPDIEVTKTADPTEVPETGANVDFTFVVTNNGPEEVTLTSLADTVYGELLTAPVTIAAGETYELTITRWIEGTPGEDHYNVTTATAHDNEENEDTDTDDETVVITNVPDISGTKWYDLDGDGILDTGEPPLGGVTIQLWSQDDLLASTVTDSEGNYLFENVAPGVYAVTEVVPSGTHATTPASVTVTIEEGSEEDVTGIDFMNAPYGSISGTKWDDPNSDGIHQSTEVGVQGVAITLTMNGVEIAGTTTASDGTYHFDDLVAGEYVVSETVPSGFTATTPASVMVSLDTGEAVTGIDFLNVAVAEEVIVVPTEPKTDTKTETLPYTGLNVLPWLLAAALFMLAGVLAFFSGMIIRLRK